MNDALLKRNTDAMHARTKYSRYGSLNGSCPRFIRETDQGGEVAHLLCIYIKIWNSLRNDHEKANFLKWFRNGISLLAMRTLNISYFSFIINIVLL